MPRISETFGRRFRRGQETRAERVCKYCYVFADGKTNQAVGVVATPESVCPKSVQFVRPGESHKLLGEGIEDAVVLSAGTRLESFASACGRATGNSVPRAPNG